MSTNSQDVNIVITAKDVGAPINISQEIQSHINVNQLLDRSNKNQLVNDLQNVVENSLRDAILTSTDFLADLFAIPANQKIRQDVLNNLSTYVRNTINLSTVDQLLLSSSNYQKGSLTITSDYLTGPITFNQKIQSNIMADNIVKDVIDNAIQNREVQQLVNLTENQIEREATAPLSDISRGVGAGVAAFGANAGSKIWAYALIIIGVIILIVGIIVGIVAPTKPGAKGAIIAVSVIIALVLIGVGIFLAVKSPTVAAVITK